MIFSFLHNRCYGNNKGKQKLSPSKCTRHLSKPEMMTHTDGMVCIFIQYSRHPVTTVSTFLLQTSQAILSVKHETYTFNIKSDYHVSFKSTFILLEPVKREISLCGFKLCCSVDDVRVRGVLGDDARVGGLG